MADPWANFPAVQPSAAPSNSGDPIIAPPDPYKRQQADLANRDQQIQEENLQITREKEDRARREWAATHNPDGSPKAADTFNASALYEARIDAANKLRNIRAIRLNAEQPGAVGSIFTDTLTSLPSTAARTVAANINNVKKGGALTKILEMTKATGKNPFTPMSNSDVDLIADTQGALDQGLAKPEFFRQLDPFEGAYMRAYVGAGGNLTSIYRNDPNAREIDRQRNILDKRLKGKSDAERQQAYAVFFAHPDIAGRLPNVGKGGTPTRSRATPAQGWGEVERED